MDLAVIAIAMTAMATTIVSPTGTLITATVVDMEDKDKAVLPVVLIPGLEDADEAALLMALIPVLILMEVLHMGPNHGP